MEMLNQIHLRGIVGNACAQKVGDTEVIRFSVMTEYAYTSRDCVKVIDVTWHNCTAFKSPKMPDFSTIVKGAGVEVKVRSRNYRFTDTGGSERTMSEILVSEVTVLGDVPSTL